MKYLKPIFENKNLKVRSKDEIEMFYIDLLDEDKFRYEIVPPGNTGVHATEIGFMVLLRNGWRYISLNNKKKEIGPGENVCYYVQLSSTSEKLRRSAISIPSPPIPNFDTPYMKYINIGTEEVIEVLEEMINIKGRANDNGLDFCYNYDGYILRMMFMEKNKN